MGWKDLEMSADNESKAAAAIADPVLRRAQGQI